jgi:hypothetical protein
MAISGADVKDEHPLNMSLYDIKLASVALR